MPRKSILFVSVFFVNSIFQPNSFCIPPGATQALCDATTAYLGLTTAPCSKKQLFHSTDAAQAEAYCIEQIYSQELIKFIFASEIEIAHRFIARVSQLRQHIPPETITANKDFFFSALFTSEHDFQVLLGIPQPTKKSAQKKSILENKKDRWRTIFARLNELIHYSDLFHAFATADSERLVVSTSVAPLISRESRSSLQRKSQAIHHFRSTLKTYLKDIPGSHLVDFYAEIRGNGATRHKHVNGVIAYINSLSTDLFKREADYLNTLKKQDLAPTPCCSSVRFDLFNSFEEDLTCNILI